MALLKGTLDVLVLKALSWTPLHAFEVATWIERHSAGQFVVEDAALMQALRRLEERGLLAADWGTTENARRAKYYRLTRAGREHLREESRRLADYANALTAMLKIRSANG